MGLYRVTVRHISDAPGVEPLAVVYRAENEREAAESVLFEREDIDGESLCDGEAYEILDVEAIEEREA